MLMSLLLFLHITGLSLWFGSALLLTILFASLKKQQMQESVRTLVFLCTKIVNRLLSIAAIAVLFSGIGLVGQLGYFGMEKPFWLSFMEQAGGTVILLFVALFTWKNRRVAKQLVPGTQQGQTSKVAGWYASALGAFAVAITIVLTVVSLRVV